jgi:hypothetical protein
MVSARDRRPGLAPNSIALSPSSLTHPHTQLPGVLAGGPRRQADTSRYGQGRVRQRGGYVV